MRAAAKMLRGAKRMTVTSAAGTDLDVDMAGALDGRHLGLDREARHAGALAGRHRGELSRRAGGVNGTLVLDRGDVNLTFKRYLDAPMRLTLENDYVTKIEGDGADAEMMRSYLAAWGDRDAYAVSHVGFGMNPKARYEALAMYDQRDTNGTETARGRRQFPVLDRRQRIRRPLHRRALRHAGDAHHDHASTTPWSCATA